MSQGDEPDPSVQIPWRLVHDEAERSAIIDLLTERGLPNTPRAPRVRQADLVFYRNHRLVEVAEVEDSQSGLLSSQDDLRTIRAAYSLVGLDELDVTFLDLTNRPIYEINGLADLDLTGNNLLKYVSFFLSSCAGPYGLMPLIERLEAAQAEAGFGTPDQSSASELKAKLEELSKFIPPTPIETGQENILGVKAALLFQGGIFAVTIHVEIETGIVRVEQHEMMLGPGAEGEAPSDD